MDNCIFCKIGKHEMKSTMHFENDKVIAIQDIHPVAPVHLLIIPKAHVREFSELTDNDTLIAIKDSIQELIKANGLQDKGYKLEANGGGAQMVDHLHIHLIGPVKSPVAK